MLRVRHGNLGGDIEETAKAVEEDRPRESVKTFVLRRVR